MINAINTALSGLLASSKRIEASASNIANLNTTGSLNDPDNAPYSALTTIQETVTDSDGNGQGVKATNIPKNTPFVPAFDPDSPFANKEGLIGAPNVNLAEEAVNINISETTFKANLKVIETVDQLSEELFRSFDREI